MVICQTYTIKERDGGWYWHVSTPGRPGDESFTFSTRVAAEQNVQREYPEAIPAELEEIYNKVPGRWLDDFMKAMAVNEEPSDEFWQVGMKDKKLRELFEQALRRDWLGNALSDPGVWECTILGKVPENVRIDCRYVGTVLNKTEFEIIARNVCVMQKQVSPKAWTPFTAKEYAQFCNNHRDVGKVGNLEISYLDQLAQRGFLTCTQPKAAILNKSYEVNER
jgi:hypothetical protein